MQSRSRNPGTDRGESSRENELAGEQRFRARTTYFYYSTGKYISPRYFYSSKYRETLFAWKMPGSDRTFLR